MVDEGAETVAAKLSALANVCSTVCREIIRDLPAESRMGPMDHEQENLRIARMMFGKWTIEILSMLYSRRQAGFEEIRKELSISSKVLGAKLFSMERLGLVEREILPMRPPRVKYSLSAKGLHIAKLGEPVLLYMRFTEGFLVERHRGLGTENRLRHSAGNGSRPATSLLPRRRSP